MKQKKNAKVNTKPQKAKLSKEEREKIDNKIVLATAIALISAMVFLYLQNWFASVYAATTGKIITALKWIGVAGIAAFIALVFIKKDKKYLFCIPYCAVGSLFMNEILKAPITKLIYGLFDDLILKSNITFLVKSFNSFFAYYLTKSRFNFIFLCLAIYLIASYIYYGVKIAKGNKEPKKKAQ